MVRLIINFGACLAHVHLFTSFISCNSRLRAPCDHVQAPHHVRLRFEFRFTHDHSTRNETAGRLVWLVTVSVRLVRYNAIRQVRRRVGVVTTVPVVAHGSEFRLITSVFGSSHVDNVCQSSSGIESRPVSVTVFGYYQFMYQLRAVCDVRSLW